MDKALKALLIQKGEQIGRDWDELYQLARTTHLVSVQKKDGTMGGLLAYVADQRQAVTRMLDALKKQEDE